MSVVHLHLLMNHVPIVGAVIGIALLAYAFVRRSSEVGKLSLGLFVALAAVSIMVFLTGEPTEEAIENVAGVSNAVVEEHEEIARVATIAIVTFGVLALGALTLFRRRLLPRGVIAAGLAMSFVVGGLMAATANLGGQIRHSEIRSGATAQGVDHEEDREVNR